jgi:hypothetical protein
MGYGSAEDRGKRRKDMDAGEAKARLPRFTNAEVLEAFAAVMPPQELHALRSDFGSRPDETCRTYISDGLYLILAALSPDYAERVTRSRPDLAEAVASTREDPEHYLSERRAALRAGDTGAP